MSITNTSLFEGERVRLAPRDPERDAELESRWTHDAELMHLTSGAPARPLSPAQVKKRYLEDDKQKNAFFFAVRTRSDDRLIGYVALSRVHWGHAVGTLSIAIANSQDRDQGYGTEVLSLILRYAFDELNLFRVEAMVGEYNSRALEWLAGAGFVVEVRNRQAIVRGGRCWDRIEVGLLRSEWKR